MSAAAFFGDTSSTAATSTYLLWYLVYAAIFALFYIFSSPFTGNRELRKSWTGYVYVSTILYIWLGMAVAFHLPILHYDVRVPVSLFSPLFLASVMTLLAAEGACKVMNRWFVFHVGFRANSLEVIQNSAVLALAICLVYSQCGTVSNEGLAQEWLSATMSGLMSTVPSTPADSVGSEQLDHVCLYLFSGHVNSRYAHLPMVFVLWSTAVGAIVVNYVVERISGVRGMFLDASLAQRARDNAAADPMQPQMRADDVQAKQKERDHRQMRESRQLLGTASSSAPVVHSYKSQLKRIRPNLFKDMIDPPMLEMVPWYALLTTFTGVDMLIHLKLFVGRFDMRTLLAVTPNALYYPPPLYPGDPKLARAGFPTGLGLMTDEDDECDSSFLSENISLNSSATSTPRAPASAGPTPGPAPVSAQFQQQHFHVHQHHLDAPLVYDHCAEDDELWFDWMADCGDGWNSSYQVARVLAKPFLNVSVRRKGGMEPGALRLPRAKMLIIGGDLAYPSPNETTYETRLFRPFQCAMPPPLNYDPAALSMHKPPIPGGVAGLKDYKGPTCFSIPGNHDWFDGLQTYIRYICCRDWLGGWLMPQERSYFALQLPRGWWFFGLDNALSDDIDALQFKYFASLIDRMGADDRVIVAQHEPAWLLDTHDQRTTGENTNYLIRILKGRVALRMAGDLHCFMRHMPSPIVPDVKSTIKAKVRTAFAKSTAGSLVRGVVDALRRDRGAAVGVEEDTVAGIVDATINRAAESARALAAEHAANVRALASVAAESDPEPEAVPVPDPSAASTVSYSSTLYSRFTAYGGDGEGIFLEDIQDSLNPAMPLMRTQSLPSVHVTRDIRRDLGIGFTAEEDEQEEEEEEEEHETKTSESELAPAVDLLVTRSASPRLEFPSESPSSAPTAPEAPLPRRKGVYRESVRAWTVDEVLDWLSALGVHDDASHAGFADHEVSGARLLEMDLAYLTGIGIVSQLKRSKIITGLHELRQRIQAEAETDAEMEAAEAAAAEAAAIAESKAEAEAREAAESSTLATVEEVVLPPVPPELPRAASGPELSVTSLAVDADYAFPRRNVDPLSISADQPLTIEHAALSGAAIVISALAETAAAEADASVSSGSTSSTNASLTVPVNPLTIPVPSTPTPRDKESLFGPVAVGSLPTPVADGTPLRMLSPLPVRPPVARTFHPHAVTRSSLSPPVQGGEALLYNSSGSTPIPTGLGDAINLPFPDGSAAPIELRDAEADPEASNDGGSSLGAEHVRPPPVLIVSGGGGAFMHPTHCFEENTRLLTTDGWLFGREIKSRLAASDKVPLLFACYDVASQSLVYRPAVGNRLQPDFHQPARGALVDFTSTAEQRRWTDDSGADGADAANSNGVSLRVTHEHTMFAQLGGGAMDAAVPHASVDATGRSLRADTFLAVEDAAEEDRVPTPEGLRFLAAAAAGVQRTEQERGQLLQHMRALGLAPCARCVSGQPHAEPVASTRISPPECQVLAFLELYGFWLRDDSIHSADQADNDWLHHQLAACGLTNSDNDWRAMFDQQLIANGKCLAEWVLTLLDKEQLRWMIHGVWRADESWADQSQVIHASNADFVSELSVAMMHAGYSTRILKMNDDTLAVHFASFTDDRESSSMCPSLSTKTDVREVPYDGEVWCVTVDHPDHLVVAQRAHCDKHGVITNQSVPVIVGNCPDPDPILFRGNRYVRASSYPPVHVSRALALLNLFGFRKQNWRFDMVGGVLYFLLAFSVLPVCNLDNILQAESWHDALLQYILAIFDNYCLVLSKGYVSLAVFVFIWGVLVSFGEAPWPWYKRMAVGTAHALAHQLAAIGALVLMEAAVEMGVHRKLLGGGEVLYLTFVRSFPQVAAFVDQADTQAYGLFGSLARFVSNVFDVPDNLAFYKESMCDAYDAMTRGQVLLYYFNAGLYLWVLMTPLASFTFGAYLYFASTLLSAHYTEAFSSLRIEGYKNIVRMHINRAGDLEIYTLGLDRVPKMWSKDPNWSGHTAAGTQPSHEWSHPSLVRPEKGQPDQVKLIDFLVIPRNPRDKRQFARNAAAIAQANARASPMAAPMPTPPSAVAAAAKRTVSLGDPAIPVSQPSRRTAPSVAPITTHHSKSAVDLHTPGRAMD